LTAAKTNPTDLSRVNVQVVARASTSTSPGCGAVKRCCVVVVTKRSFAGSPRIVAANARQ
jgi:hypothetical protein